MASFKDSSWDSKKQRTKEELHTYYKAPNYFNKKGYKSIVYGKTYYDGYGFNYYNGNYGYYAYSRPPLYDTGPYWEMGKFFIVFAFFLAVIAAFTTLYYMCDTGRISCCKKNKEENNNDSLKKSLRGDEI